MDADWYVDPLERFEGRFFDGEVWTAQVSANGELAIDPDWPPAETGERPAVEAIESSRPRQASMVEESPVRQVAVLEDPAPVPHRQAQKSRLPLILMLLAIAVVVGLVAILWSSSDSEEPASPPAVADPETSAPTQSEIAQAEELEVDAPAGLIEPGTQFDEQEVIEVGALRIVNGVSVLDDLEAWHQDFAAERGIELADGATCWFGRLGDAAVQNAHCGPVGGSADTEFLYDLVPLIFDGDNTGQTAQPVIEAASIDAVLANSLELVGKP